MIVYETTGRRDHELAAESESTEPYYRSVIYNAVVDSWIGELRRRFSDENRQLMASVHACSPLAGVLFLDSDLLRPLVEHYGLGDKCLLEVQCMQAKAFLSVS